MDQVEGLAVDFDVPAAMRDGVTLRADIYRPSGNGRWPTLLVRTPYSKTTKMILEAVDPLNTARAGFTVVLQDTRGRGSSDGVWKPFAFDRQDGFDSVEWAATLPSSNGSVGMYGESYLGWTQWSAAFDRPKALKAIAPALTWSDPSDGVLLRGGVPELGFCAYWTLLTGLGHLERLELTDEQLNEQSMAMVDDIDNLHLRGFWELPTTDMQVIKRHRIPAAEVLTRRLGDGEVVGPRVIGRYDDVELPTLNVGGWFDLFGQGVIDSYVEMSERGNEARLLIGPWAHDGWTDPIGEGLFGLLSSRWDVPNNELGDLALLQREFLRGYLDPDSNVGLPGKRVRYFVMGVNEWREADSWPPHGACPQNRFLRADGAISEEEPDADESAAEFQYDPADPVPTKGGAVMLPPAYTFGSVDQSEIEKRDDVLVFTSAELEHPLEVTGRVRLVLHAASSAPSTDWVARLCDVHPEGNSMNICDGILRVDGDAGGVARHEIDLWSTSHVFVRGHRLRIHLTSSSFPRWERNLNTGDQAARQFVTAHQMIHLSRENPSYIVLPVMGGFADSSPSPGARVTPSSTA